MLVANFGLINRLFFVMVGQIIAIIQEYDNGLNSASGRYRKTRASLQPSLICASSSVAALCALSGAALWPVVTSEGPGHNPLAWCATVSPSCSRSHVPHWSGLRRVHTGYSSAAIRAPMKSSNRDWSFTQYNMDKKKRKCFIPLMELEGMLPSKWLSRR